MGIRKLKPNTPGTRYQSISTFDEITKSTPEKSLTVALKKSGGRNNLGRLTSRHIGGGHKRIRPCTLLNMPCLSNPPQNMLLMAYNSRKAEQKTRQLLDQEECLVLCN